MKRHLPPAAILLMTVLAAAVVAAPPGCAHVSPAQFANCMKDGAAGASLINAVNDILDGDNRTAVLEQLAVALGPDVIKCVLEQIAGSKSGTPDGNRRSLRAREYLDAHGGSAELLKARRALGGELTATPSETYFIDGPPLTEI